MLIFTQPFDKFFIIATTDSHHILHYMEIISEIDV